jgi:hypothetical protein
MVRRFRFCGDANAAISAGSAEISQNGERFAGLGADRVIGIHVGGTNYAFAVDHEARRYRQFPRVVAIEFCQIHIEFAVDPRQIIGEPENNAESARHLIVRVAQNFKGQMECVSCRGGVFRKLRRERHERCA